MFCSLRSLKSPKTSSDSPAKNKSETLDRGVQVHSVKTKPRTRASLSSRNSRSLIKPEADKKSSKSHIATSESHLKSSSLLRNPARPLSRSARPSSVSSAKQIASSKALPKAKTSINLQAPNSVRTKVAAKPKRVFSVRASSSQSTEKASSKK